MIESIKNNLASKIAIHRRKVKMFNHIDLATEYKKANKDAKTLIIAILYGLSALNIILCFYLLKVYILNA